MLHLFFYNFFHFSGVFFYNFFHFLEVIFTTFSFYSYKNTTFSCTVSK